MGGNKRSRACDETHRPLEKAVDALGDDGLLKVLDEVVLLALALLLGADRLLTLIETVNPAEKRIDELPDAARGLVEPDGKRRVDRTVEGEVRLGRQRRRERRRLVQVLLEHRQVNRERG